MVQQKGKVRRKAGGFMASLPNVWFGTSKKKDVLIKGDDDRASRQLKP